MLEKFLQLQNSEKDTKIMVEKAKIKGEENLKNINAEYERNILSLKSDIAKIHEELVLKSNTELEKELLLLDTNTKEQIDSIKKGVGNTQKTSETIAGLILTVK